MTKDASYKRLGIIIRLSLTNFADVRNMVVCSARFKSKKIHKAIRLDNSKPDLSCGDRRANVSNVLDVRTFCGPIIDSVHYHVGAKIRTHLCVPKNARQQTQVKFELNKL